LKKTVTIEAVICCLYLFNVLALQFNHLNFWIVTLTFLASAIEVWFGSALLRWLPRLRSLAS